MNCPYGVFGTAAWRAADGSAIAILLGLLGLHECRVDTDEDMLLVRIDGYRFTAIGAVIGTSSTT